MFTLELPGSLVNWPPEVRVQSMVKEAKSKEQQNTYFYINFKILFCFSYDLGLKFSKTRYFNYIKKVTYY